MVGLRVEHGLELGLLLRCRLDGEEEGCERVENRCAFYH